MIFPVRTWAPLLFPAVLLIVLLVIVAICPVAAWAAYGAFGGIPYIVFGVAFLLGMFFTQSRVSFLCLLLAGVTLLVQRAVFVNLDPARGEAVIFLCSVYFPPLAVLFYHLSERGMFNAHGGVRFLIILSALLMILALSSIPSVARHISTSPSVLFEPLSDRINIPTIGVLFFLGAIPFLLIRNPHESPHLGRIFGFAFLFVFTALNLGSHSWSEKGETVLILFMSGAGATFAWAVLESSWRNAHIDELTELPGRRALKHRLASLGSTYAIAILDIDYFKKINDRHGHDTGDQVLRFVAAQLRKREKGRAYRYGGEEFVIVCEDVGLDAMVADMDELRRAIDRRRFVIRSKDRPKEKPKVAPPPISRLDERTLHITVSIGVAADGAKHPSADEALLASDKALYAAKRDGRNCVRFVR